jgi:hypothetical protein
VPFEAAVPSSEVVTSRTNAEVLTEASTKTNATSNAQVDRTRPTPDAARATPSRRQGGIEAARHCVGAACCDAFAHWLPASPVQLSTIVWKRSRERGASRSWYIWGE